MWLTEKLQIIMLSASIAISSSNARGDAVNDDIIEFGSFIYSEKVPGALFLLSEIEKDDSFDLRKALRSKNVDTIVLASDGGLVKEALNLAGIIFDNKISTYVPELPGSFGCFSACAFMYLSGNQRLADGKLGVHQIAYAADVDSKQHVAGKVQQATQYTISEIIGFLNHFDTPPWVFEKMFLSREMYIFSKEESDLLRKGGIDEQRKKQLDSFIFDLISLPIESCIQHVEDILGFRKIDFQPGTANITESGKETLGHISNLLALCSEGEIEIGGHTDSQGRAGMNLDLSQSRAVAVMRFLMDHEKFKVKFVARGYGESFPRADNGTTEGRETNRRIEFRIK